MGSKRTVNAGRGRLVGRTLEGRYHLTELLGRGGMGEVYRARQLLAGRDVALKVVSEARLGSGKAVRRFRREVRATASLRSPHTVTLYDVGETEDGETWYTMELLDGIPLSHFLRQGGPLSWELATSIVEQVLDSLAEAHEQGILHRDLKPSNIMVCDAEERPRIVVMDFGMASMHTGPESNSVSAEELGGTPQYMSPEQVLAQPLGPPSDLYAVAVILFEMVTGRPIFQGESPIQVALDHLNRTAPRLCDVAPGGSFPDGAEELLAHALCKEPAKRFSCSSKFRQALEKVRSGTPDPSWGALAGVVSPLARGRADTEEWAIPGAVVLGEADTRTLEPVEVQRVPPTRRSAAGLWRWSLAGVAAVALVAGVILLPAWFSGQMGGGEGSRPTGNLRDEETLQPLPRRVLPAPGAPAAATEACPLDELPPEVAEVPVPLLPEPPAAIPAESSFGPRGTHECARVSVRALRWRVRESFRQPAVLSTASATSVQASPEPHESVPSPLPPTPDEFRMDFLDPETEGTGG